MYDNNSYKSIINNKLLELTYDYLSFIKYNFKPFFNNDKFLELFIYINIKKQNESIHSIVSQQKKIETNYQSIKNDIDIFNSLKFHINSLESQLYRLIDKTNLIENKYLSLESSIHKSIHNLENNVFLLFKLFFLIIINIINIYLLINNIY